MSEAVMHVRIGAPIPPGWKRAIDEDYLCRKQACLRGSRNGRSAFCCLHRIAFSLTVNYNSSNNSVYGGTAFDPVYQ